MLKTGLYLLFATFSQLIFVVIAYAFFFRYAAFHGGIGGTVLSNVHPVIWWLISFELVIALVVVVLGLRKEVTHSEGLEDI